MRRAFVVAEVAAALFVIAVAGGAGVVMFARLTRQTLATRTHAIAVHEISNALEELKANPTLLPGIGEEKVLPLSDAVAERCPNLRITLTAREADEGKALRRVRIVATEERGRMPTRQTNVEVLVRADARREATHE